MHFARHDGPLVLAHRFDPARATPGTLDAFDLAEADGADGLHLEVRLSADGEVIVLAEPEVVLGNRRLPVSALTALELATVTLGKDERQGSVPFLRHVLARYGGDLRLLVELMPGPAPRPGLLEFRVAALLTQHHALGRAVCLSGSVETLRRLREAQPDVETGILLEGALPAQLPAGATSIAVAAAVAESYLGLARPLGIGVHALGVGAADARRLADAGARSLVTDRPAEVVAALLPGEGAP